jgi:hypothetical protein
MNYTIDTHSKQITFLDNRFYQTESGSYVPSVTTIGDAYPKGPEYFAWIKKVGEDADTIRDEAGRRGSIVHELTEKYDAGEEISLLSDTGRIGFKLSEWAMFERYVDFRSRFELEILMSEFNIINEKLGYAGTLDRVVEMGGKKILLDIKTSNAIYPFYWLQLAAYKKLYESIGLESGGIDEVAILWLNAKTRTTGSKGAIQGIGWQLVTREKDLMQRDIDMFEATHKLWLAENGTMQPKKLQYQLTHKL